MMQEMKEGGRVLRCVLRHISSLGIGFVGLRSERKKNLDFSKLSNLQK